MSTHIGNCLTALRISLTCSPVIAPAACAAATAGSSGANGCPVRLFRGPRSAASCSRRDASALESRHRTLSTSFHDLAPIALGVVSACNRANSR